LKRIRSCLFLDFDNVYSGLVQQSKRAAEAFCRDPMSWIRWLESSELTNDGDVSRRILVRKCYMNPQMFGAFRPYFVKSSFQVIDCPPLTERGKNSADIHMVVDTLGYLEHRVEFDEFIIMSSDSDFTPLLVKLRENDRQTVIISTGLSAATYRNTADIVVEQAGFVELLESFSSLNSGKPAVAPPAGHPRAPTPKDQAAFVRRVVGENGGQMVLANLSLQIKKEYAGQPGLGDWFGSGKFTSFLEGLQIEGLVIDSSVPPGYAAIGDPPTGDEPIDDDATLANVHRVLDVPILPPDTYRDFFHGLADYLKDHEYSLTECSKALRDLLLDRGHPFSRKASNFLLIGLSRERNLKKGEVSAQELREAFLANLLKLAKTAQLILGDDEKAELEKMLGD